MIDDLINDAHLALQTIGHGSDLTRRQVSAQWLEQIARQMREELDPPATRYFEAKGRIWKFPPLGPGLWRTSHSNTFSLSDYTIESLRDTYPDVKEITPEQGEP